MVSQFPAGRLSLDVVFALFLVNGLLICATVLAAIAALASRDDDRWMGVFALGMSTLLPSILAWLASGVRSFMRPKDAGVRLGATLATAQLLLWAVLVALGRFSSISKPSGWLLAVPMLGTACYGVAATWLALRWFFSRRRRFSEQVNVSTDG
jgi:hypothetical protein